MQGFDYTRAGAYFITLCTHDRAWLFGDSLNGIVQLNPMGEIARAEWTRTGQVRPRVTIDAFVVMPDHLHGILVIEGQLDTPAGVDAPSAVDTPPGAHTYPGADAPPGRGTLQRAPTPTPWDRAPTSERFGHPTSGSIPTIVRLYKSTTTKRINILRGTPGMPVWQRNFYEHIIGSETELHAIRRYIRENPLRWALDPDNPATW